MVGQEPLKLFILVRIQVSQPTRAPESVKGLERDKCAQVAFESQPGIVGVAVGYILFIGFMRIYRNISHYWDMSANPILQYIAERPQIDA